MANIIWKYCLLCKHCCRYYNNKNHCFHWRIFYIITFWHLLALSVFQLMWTLCHNIKNMAWAFYFVSLWVDPSPYIYWAFIKSMFFVQPIWCTMHWFPCGQMRHVINCDICCPMWQTPLESILSCDKRYKQVFQYNPQPGQRFNN